jgi:hypothetical protein
MPGNKKNEKGDLYRQESTVDSILYTIWIEGAGGVERICLQYCK